VFSRSHVRLLVLSILVVTVSTQPVFLVGAAFFQIGPEFGLSNVGLGVLTACFFLASSASSLLLGRWVQRVGWQRAMRINLAGSAATLFLTTLLARSGLALGLLLVLSASWYGMANPAANLSLAQQTDPERAATVFGLKHAGIPTSTLLAGFAVPALVIHVGWRWSFVASGVLGLVVFGLIPRSVPPGPERHASAPSRGLPLDRRGLIDLAVVSALGAVAASALGTFLVSAGLSEGFSEAQAGWLQSVGSLVSITTRVAVGMSTDRRRVAGFRGLFVLIALGAGFFSLIAVTSGVVFTVVVIAAFATGWGWPGLMTYTVVDANRASAASSSAVTQAGVFIGAGAGPFVLGLVVDRWSFEAAWLVVAACLGLGAFLVRRVKVHHALGGAAGRLSGT
jgi:MFS family permease